MTSCYLLLLVWITWVCIQFDRRHCIHSPSNIRPGRVGQCLPERARPGCRDKWVAVQLFDCNIEIDARVNINSVINKGKKLCYRESIRDLRLEFCKHSLNFRNQ